MRLVYILDDQDRMGVELTIFVNTLASLRLSGEKLSHIHGGNTNSARAPLHPDSYRDSLFPVRPDSNLIAIGISVRI